MLGFYATNCQLQVSYYTGIWGQECSGTLLSPPLTVTVSHAAWYSTLWCAQVCWHLPVSLLIDTSEHIMLCIPVFYVQGEAHAERVTSRRRYRDILRGCRWTRLHRIRGPNLTRCKMLQNGFASRGACLRVMMTAPSLRSPPVQPPSNRHPPVCMPSAECPATLVR